MADNPFKSFRATPFVSQYAGLPLDEFVQSATNLQQRSAANMAQVDNLEILADQIQVMDIDQSLKDERLAHIRSTIDNIAATGDAYEHAGALVRGEAKAFRGDKNLSNASRTFANVQKMQAEADEVDASAFQRINLQRQIDAYNEKGGAAANARVGQVSFYEEADIPGEVSKILAGWKAEGRTTFDDSSGMYIDKTTNKFVTEAELKQEALAYLDNNPKFARQLQDQARYGMFNDLYSATAVQLEQGLIAAGVPLEEAAVTAQSQAKQQAYKSAYSPETFEEQEMLSQYYNNEREQAVSLGVRKYSFLDQSKTRTQNPTQGNKYGLFNPDGTPFTFETAQFDHQLVPQSGKELRTQLRGAETRLGEIDKALEKNVSPGLRANLEGERDQLLQQQALLKGYEDSYYQQFESSLSEQELADLKLYDAAPKEQPKTSNYQDAFSSLTLGSIQGRINEQQASKAEAVRNSGMTEAEYDAAMARGAALHAKRTQDQGSFSEHLQSIPQGRTYTGAALSLETDAQMPILNTLANGSFNVYGSGSAGAVPPNDVQVLQSFISNPKNATAVALTNQQTNGKSGMIVRLNQLPERTIDQMDGDQKRVYNKYVGQQLDFQDAGSQNVIQTLSGAVFPSFAKSSPVAANVALQGAGAYGEIPSFVDRIPANGTVSVPNSDLKVRNWNGNYYILQKGETSIAGKEAMTKAEAVQRLSNN